MNERLCILANFMIISCKNLNSTIFEQYWVSYYLNYISNKNFEQLDEWIKFKQKIKINFFWDLFIYHSFLA